MSITAAAGTVGLAALAPAATATDQAQARSPFHPAPSQLVARLKANEVTYARPDGRRMGSVSHYRPITGEVTTLPVLRKTTKGRTTWLDVRLPGRPNSHTGWIKAAHTSLRHITWHIYVTVGPDTSSFSVHRRVYVYNHGRLVKSWLAVTGAPGRVTPTGQFFVEENVNLGWHSPGGPFALATSARSDTYTRFDGGPGQIAIHGMADGLEARPGTAVSHGCIRLKNNEIIWLAHRIIQGTPVTILK